MKRIETMSKEDIIEILLYNNTKQCDECVGLELCNTGQGLNLTCEETINMYFYMEVDDGDNK